MLEEALNESGNRFTNLQLPGNPRYQPRSLQKYVGYDKLYLYYVAVEVAMLKVMALNGKLSEEAMDQMNEVSLQNAFTISTTETDELERKETKHDIRALVRLIQSKVPVVLRRYIHVPMTSYDVIDTAQALWMQLVHVRVVGPLLKQLMDDMASFTERNSSVVQIGRTHNMHALPITVGFWSANILGRIYNIAGEMDHRASQLIGKISGPVGAGNALIGLDLQPHGVNFETEVLGELGLKPGLISSQIAHPEPRARYLFEVVLMSAALAQLGEDGRNLMRREVNELFTVKAKGQVGSSSMPHKNNPITFESLAGLFFKNKAEFYKVLESLNSDHQRDLRNSALLRDMLTLIVNLVEGLEKLTKRDGNNQSFFDSLVVNEQALKANLKMSAHLVIAEPLYLALQQYGYQGDAHKLINDVLAPEAVKSGKSLITQLNLYIGKAGTDKSLIRAVRSMPDTVKQLLDNPETYTGYAQEKAMQVVSVVRAYEPASFM